jgi:signal transduction histidine kinase
VLASLSGRLLTLTVATVMVIQVAILAPSLSRFRFDWLNDRLAIAQVASLALLANPEGVLERDLEVELLARTAADGIVLRRNGAQALVLNQLIPSAIDETVDLREADWVTLLSGAVRTLWVDGDRFIRVIGYPFPGSGDEVEVTMRASPLKAAMASYARRTIYLSLALSAAVALVLYLLAQGLFLRPVRRLVAHMARFSEDPEDSARILRPVSGPREIAEAESALARMETDVQEALRQRARLAALGEAVAKISHDLRNILASAQLMAERFETSRDPLVNRIGPKLIGSIGRAIALCESTLRYGRAEEAEPSMRRVALSALIREAGENVFPAGAEAPGLRFENRAPEETLVFADADQLFRIFLNLFRNARDALEASGRGGRVIVEAEEADGTVRVDIRDDGPGLPTKALENLFQPFTGGARKGGAGLGLAIAHELSALQGGRLELLATSTAGTTFRVSLQAAPDDWSAARGAAPRRSVSSAAP